MTPITIQDPEARSADVMEENLRRLEELFPEAFNEGGIDFEVLQQLLGHALDEREEKYGFTWHGKRRARQLALMPSTGTLRPCAADSVEWDATQNLVIEGDNLEALKLLQKTYSGEVKMIYIDPPYNTGKDFIYPDDFQDNIQNYLALTGQTDLNGRKIASNTESSGRFHTNWLNMIYPRLRLARNLLSRDGVIFISIDDHEVDNLRKICTEIFGETNFVAQFVWNTEGHTDNQFDVKVNHEYVLLYARDASWSKLGHVIDPNTRQQSNLWKGYAENSITKNGSANPPSEINLPAGFPCKVGQLDLPKSSMPEEFFRLIEQQGYITRSLTDRFGATYPVRLDPMLADDGHLERPCRVFSGWANANKLRAFIANGCQSIEEEGGTLSFYLSENGVIYYRRDREKARNILSVLKNLGTTERMRSELEKTGIPFQYPKPKELVRYLVQIGAEAGGVVLDFFAGSGVTASAVVSQNLEDKQDRRYILVQLPEPLDPTNKDQASAVQFCDTIGKPRNVAEITKEHLRRLAARIQEDNPMLRGDVGFRVFRLDSSNIRAWEPDREDLPATLEESVEHLESDRTEQDILFELLLKLGLDLAVPMGERTIAGKTVHSVGAGALLVCLAQQVAAAEVEPLGQGIVAWFQELEPAGEPMIVFRDSAFADDVAKTNLTAILQQHGLQNVRSI